MDEKAIHLTDGSTISAKVNFGTVYYIQKLHLDKMISKIDEAKKNGNEDQDAETELTAKMLYVLILSNGRKVSFEDCLVLMPIDVSEIEDVFKEFGDKLETVKKNTDSKRQMNQFLETK